MELSGRRWTTFFYSPVLKSSFHFTVQINKGDSPNSPRSILFNLPVCTRNLKMSAAEAAAISSESNLYALSWFSVQVFVTVSHEQSWVILQFTCKHSLHEFQFTHISKRQYFSRWYFIELQVSSYHMINTGLESISGDHEGFRKHNTNMHVD